MPSPDKIFNRAIQSGARRNRRAACSGATDFMVIYAEGGLCAIYFDTEGHVIHYKAFYLLWNQPHQAGEVQNC